jgi:hypothetical protein
MRKYKTFISGTNKKCLREFGCSFDELQSKENKTDAESNFIKYYYERIPVGVAPCVMNRICKFIEIEFDSLHLGFKDVTFNADLIKYGFQYSPNRYNEIEKVYEEYTTRMRDIARESANRRIAEKDDFHVKREQMKTEFKAKCESICSNKYELCDILIDMCYTTNTSKQFVWDICGSVIIENLLSKRDNTIAYPVADEFGDIVFNGNKFSLKYKSLEVD